MPAIARKFRRWEDDVPLTITIVPEGDAVDAEVVDLTTQVREALERRPEVDDVQPAKGSAPPGARPGEVMLLGALLVAVAPAAMEGVINIVRDLLSRPGTPPTKVRIKHGETEVEVEFSPDKTSPEELARLIERLKRARDG